MNHPSEPENLLQHGAWMRRLARGLLYDESRADDVVQAAWLAALTRAPRPDWNPRAWLAGVVRNLSHNAEREEARRVRRERGAARPEAVDESPSHERLEVLRQVVVAVQALDEPYRETLLLRYFDDLSPRGIAERQGVPVDTVRTRLARGLGRLRERFERQGERGLTEFLGALIPLAGPPPAGLGIGAAETATATLEWSGAAVMGLKISITVTALVLAALSWIAWDRADEDSAQPGTAVATDADAPALVPVAAEPEAPTVDEPGRTAAGPEGAVAATPSPAAGDWRVVGRTLHGADEPLPGAHVVLRLYRGAEPAGEPEQRVRLRSDAEGRFEWSLPRPAGGVTIVAHGDEDEYGSRGVLAYASRGAAPPEPLVLRFFPAERGVEGLVTDEKGEPLPCARVWTDEVKYPVDESGRFRLESARRITADAPGYAQKRAMFDSSGAGRTGAIEIRLPRELVIHGRVRDENGALIEGVELSTFYTHANEVLSGPDGAFELHSLDPGRPQHMLVGKKDGMVLASVDVPTDSRTSIEQDLVLHHGVRVEGRVTDGAGAPLRGVELYIGFSPHAFDRLDAVTDAEGRFVFPAVARGEQTLVAQLGERAPYQEVLHVPDHGVLLAGVEVVLAAGHQVRGVVVDEEGDPVAGAGVSVRWHGKYIEARAIADAAGRFHLEGLPEGDLRLGVYSRGYMRTDVTLDGLDESAAPEELRVVLSRAGSIAGRVVDGRTGEPIEAFTIRFVNPLLAEGEERGSGYSATWSREGHAFTVTDGAFETGDETLPPGAYLGIEARAKGYALTVDPHVRIELDPDPTALVLKMYAGATLGGRVVDAATGEPIEGAFVKRYTEREPINELDSDDTHGRVQTRTGAHGEFVLEGLPAERMWLLVDAPDHAPLRIGPIEIEPGVAPEERTIELTHGAVIEGVVRDGNGAPLAGVELRMRPSPDNATSLLRRTSTETGADGTFRFEQVGDGPWRLSLIEKRGWVELELRSWRVTVAGGADERVELAPAGRGVVAGTLRSDGPFPDNLPVRLEPLEGSEVERGVGTLSVFAQEGAFHLDGLPAGRYRVLSRFSDFDTRSHWFGEGEVVVPESGTASVWLDLTRRPM